MRIWIDGQCLQTGSRDRGIGRYVIGLLRAMAKQPSLELEISFNAALADTLIGARELVAPWIARERIHVWHGMAEAGEALVGYTARRQASEIAVGHHVAQLEPDLALSPSLFEGFHDQATPFLNGWASAVPSACIVYDFIPRHYPDRFLSTSILRETYDRRLDALKRFPIALAISDFTRRELLGLDYGGSASSISAGLDEAIIALSEGHAGSAPEEGEGGYLLYVGSLDWHKNVSLVADAVALIPEDQRRGLRLKLAGSEYHPHQDALRRHCAKLGLHDDFLDFVGHVSDEALARLFRGALALVHPSFMEGFGLTVLEAMQLGTPVICSTADALVEVVGDAALKFSPHSAQELAGALETLLADPGLAATLREKGLARAPSFTWDRSAELLVAALPVPQGGLNAKTISPDARRRSALRDIESLNLPFDDMLSVMALSEPSAPTRRKLIIDATSTLTSEARTGIQRVVKSICTEACRLADGPNFGAALHVAYADDASGWYDVELDSGFYGSTVVKADDRRLHIANGDVLLMLDSSWEHYQAHGVMATRARLRGATVVCCLYDFVPLTTYAFCDGGMPIAFSAWFGASLTYSDAYVCISKAVADELHEMLKAIDFPRRIDIGYWHLGADFAPSDDGAVGVIGQKVAPFRFLMVGTLEPRKGYDVALLASSALWEAGLDFELVLVGKAGWKNDDFIARLEKHAEFDRRLRWLPKSDDGELRALYASCDALIAASYAEGFGLPIVEARAFGKPVIASDIPVFREVATDGTATFFPVGSSDGLCEAMTEFMSRPQAETSVAGQKWLSWHESADALAQTVLGGHWYKTYSPRHATTRPLSSSLDLVRMTSAIEADDRKCSLELVSGPSLIEGGTVVRYIVKATNESNLLWSSRGSASGSLGVRLSYIPVTSEGTPKLIDNAVRTQIPFVIYPGQTHYMPLEVLTASLDNTIEFVDIQIVQEGVAWWGSPLRAPIR